jgi:hypothetical protein
MAEDTAVYESPFPGTPHHAPAMPPCDREVPFPQDRESQAQQIIAQILRDLEVHRLPEALAIRDQTASGEPLSDEDAACLTSTIAVLDQALGLWPNHQDLRCTRENVARLCDHIMTRAHSPRSGERPGRGDRLEPV